MTARKTIQARRSGPVQEITAKDSTAKDGTARNSSPKDTAKDRLARRGAPEGTRSPPGPAAAGPRIYNLFPLLVGTVSAWRAELPRIAGLGFDWVYLNPVHETGGSGSLYAVRDPFRLDARFRDPEAGGDDDQIRAFAEDAAVHGLKSTRTIRPSGPCGATSPSSITTARQRAPS
jgi:glycosidase